jgi:hypothetical protein
MQAEAADDDKEESPWYMFVVPRFFGDYKSLRQVNDPFVHVFLFALCMVTMVAGPGPCQGMIGWAQRRNGPTICKLTHCVQGPGHARSL